MDCNLVLDALYSILSYIMYDTCRCKSYGWSLLICIRPTLLVNFCKWQFSHVVDFYNVKNFSLTSRICYQNSTGDSPVLNWRYNVFSKSISSYSRVNISSTVLTNSTWQTSTVIGLASPGQIPIWMSIHPCYWRADIPFLLTNAIEINLKLIFLCSNILFTYESF